MIAFNTFQQEGSLPVWTQSWNEITHHKGCLGSAPHHSQGDNLKSVLMNLSLLSVPCGTYRTGSKLSVTSIGYTKSPVLEDWKAWNSVTYPSVPQLYLLSSPSLNNCRTWLQPLPSSPAPLDTQNNYCKCIGQGFYPFNNR